METFAAMVLALGLLDSILLLVLALRRVGLARRAKRRTEIEERLKPLVLRFLDGDGELPTAPTLVEEEVIADVLGAYSRMLRGPARDRITRYFEQRGVVGRELEALAYSRAAWRRAAAAFRLGDIGGGSASAGLISALGDESRDVRIAATRSLGRLGSTDAVSPIVAGIAAGAIPTAIARWAVLQIGPPALPRLRDVLDAESPARRAGAVMLIGLLGDAADAQLVEARLRDSSADVRAQAAHALSRIGGPRSLPGVTAALEDRVPAVRAAAAAALGRLQADAVDLLIELAQRDQFDVARAAAQAAAAIDLEATAAAAARSASPAHLREAVDVARLS
jgi:HEAT repeat protein